MSKSAMVIGAEWCGPCKILKKYAIPELLEEGFNIEVYDIDSELGEAKAAEFGVRGLPTTLIFDEEGIQIDSFVGSKTASQFREYLV